MVDYGYERETLPNGLRIVWLDLPHTHSVFLDATVQGGTIYESRQTAGISHLLEHLHMTATPRYPTREALVAAYSTCPGAWNASAGRDLIDFEVHTSPNMLFRAGGLLAESLEHHRHTPEIVEAEKRVIESELKAPDRDWHEQQCCRMLFNKSSFSLDPAGNAKSLRRLSQEQIHDFDTRMFRPDRTVLAVAGRIQYEQKDDIRQRFSTIPNGSDEELSTSIPTLPQLPLAVRLGTAARTATMIVGFVLQRDLSPVENACHHLLRRGLCCSSSRLYGQLRYGEGGHYHFGVDELMVGPFRLLYLWGRPRLCDLWSTVEASLRELKRIADGDIDQEWLAEQRAEYRFAIHGFMDYPSSVGGYMAWEEGSTPFRTPISIEGTEAAIDDITPERLAGFAQKLFKSDQMFIGVTTVTPLWRRSKLLDLARSILD